jgi:hypothetical protein
MSRELWMLMVVAAGVACSNGPAGTKSTDSQIIGSAEPAALDCAIYDSYLASLAELTVQCRGRLDPRDYAVSGDGALQPVFSSCSSDESKLAKIRQLLSLQRRGDRLPRLAECMVDRVTASQRELTERGLSCPTWQRSRVINPIDAATTSVVGAALAALPAAGEAALQVAVPGITRSSLTTLESEFDELRAPADHLNIFDLLEENSLYVVSQSDAQSCGSPAECAAVCADAFPGFFIGIKGQEEVVTDPIAWLLDTTYKTKAQNPYLRPLYYHPMSYYGPLPGMLFGDYARFEPCGPNSADPLCGPEQCSYYAGNHLKTFLQKDCLDPADVDTCVSFCGPPLP